MDSQLLKSKIVAYNDTQAHLASVLGISLSNLNDKINGKKSFRQNEIKAIKAAYNLTAEEVDLIFFNH